MFAIIAVPFDAFQALPRPEHRWLLTCFSRYVDRAGTAFPSLRQLAADARMSLASVSRRMAALARLEVFQRERKPGGRYRYRPGRSLPSALARARCRGVSAAETGCFTGREHRTSRAYQARQRGARAPQFANRKVSFGEIPDERAKWEARLRCWRQSRFWLPLWGPKPTEPGCFAPVEALQQGT